MKTPPPIPPKQPGRRYKEGPRQHPESHAIVERLVATIRVRGLRYDAFESRCGLPQGRITKWATGQGDPPAYLVWRMARELGVDPAYLITGEGGTMPGSADPYEAAKQIMRHLPPDEAVRRLLVNDRPGGADSHGRRSEDDAQSQKRRGAG